MHSNVAIIASKHPAALSSPARECWPEIWETIGPMLEGVMQRGEATWSDDRDAGRGRAQDHDSNSIQLRPTAPAGSPWLTAITLSVVSITGVNMPPMPPDSSLMGP
jgi:hypothetical protein